MNAAYILMATTVAAVGTAFGVDEALSSSPDKRFSLQSTHTENFYSKLEVVQTATMRTVADLSDNIMQSETDSLSILWSADSRIFAANYRGGRRYSTTSFFRWDGKTFVELTSPEALLYKSYIHPCKQHLLAEAGKPAGTYLRRVMDTWETVKWIDNSTVEIAGESTSAYYKDDSETLDVTVSVKAQIKFDAEGKPRVIKIELDPPLPAPTAS